jgi:hypothetical protein
MESSATESSAVRPLRGRIGRAGFLLVAFGLLGLELAGCGTPALPCPPARVLRDTNRVVRLGEPGSPNADKIQFIGQINEAKLNCSYDPNTYERLTVAMGIQVTAARASAQAGDTADFQYFVAIVNLEGLVLGKKIFPFHASFPPGQNEVTRVEQIYQMIPLKYPQNGGSLEVWTGFQLSDAELKFNREHFPQP